MPVEIDDAVSNADMFDLERLPGDRNLWIEMQHVFSSVGFQAEHAVDRCGKKCRRGPSLLRYGLALRCKETTGHHLMHVAKRVLLFPRHKALPQCVRSVSPVRSPHDLGRRRRTDGPHTALRIPGRIVIRSCSWLDT